MEEGRKEKGGKEIIWRKRKHKETEKEKKVAVLTQNTWLTVVAW